MATARLRAPLSASSSPNLSRNSPGERSDGTGGRRGTRIDMAGETVAMPMPNLTDQTARPESARRRLRPRFHPPVEDVEWQGSLAQELVVKGADVEACALLALR